MRILGATLSYMSKSSTPKAERVEWKPLADPVRGNASERMRDDLREQILSGKVQRGAKLPTEKELATAYGVSGATVREAVRGLATARLVDVRHGSGAYVTADVDALMATSLRSIIHIERISMPQVMGLYGALNAFAAELAAQHATPEHIRQMQEAQNDMASGKDSATLSEALRRYLSALAGASGNTLLAALCRFLAGMQIALATELSGGSYASRREAGKKLAKYRQGLIDAVIARDACAARDIATKYHKHALVVLTSHPHGGKEKVADPDLSRLLVKLLHP